MDKHEIVFGPALEVDESLFKLAPLQTLKQFTMRINRRLVRLEVIMIIMFSVDIGLRVF